MSAIATSPPGAGDSRRIPGWLVAVIVVLGTVIYAPGLTAKLTHYDDSLYIYANPALEKRGLDGLLYQWDGDRSWSGNFVEFFPLRDSVYWAIYQVWETEGTPYHVASLLFHLLATVLVFVLTVRLVPSREVAIVTTLIFLVHPIHIESVLWAAGLKDPMYTSFMLGSLVAYLNAREGRAWWYAISLVLLVASLLVKSMAISTPLLMLAIELFGGQRDTWRRIAARLSAPAITSALFLLQFILIGKANRAVVGPHGGSWAAHVVLSSWAQVKYLRQAFFPASFRLIYCFEPPAGLADWRFFVALAVAAALIAVAVLWRRHPLRLLAGAWYFACLLPVSNLVPFPAVMADRYLYAASFGACLLIALLLERLAPSPARLAALLIVVGLSATTFTRSFVWQDADQLWAEPDSDPACIVDGSAPAAQSHILRSWTAKDAKTRLAAIERAVATPGLFKLNRLHFCEMLNEGAIEVSLHGHPERGRPWAKLAVQNCRDFPRTWVAVTITNLHTYPVIAARAAAKAYRLEPSTALKAMWGLTAIEAGESAGFRLVSEAIAEDPGVSCGQLGQWAKEVDPALQTSIQALLADCATRGYSLPP
ncbi:MAG: hypothetical protein AB1938_25125 [Myxococcota bacterium]